MAVMQVRSALCAIVVGSVCVQSAQAAVAVDFCQIVEQVSPAVVRVRRATATTNA
jgi:S1-C subfamily serine protease